MRIVYSLIHLISMNLMEGFPFWVYFIDQRPEIARVVCILNRSLMVNSHFSAIKCPLEIPFGNLSSSCRGGIGERCSLNCKDDDKTTEDMYVVCLTSGVWDKDTSRLCTSRDQNGKHSFLHCYTYKLDIAVVIVN